MRGAELNIDGSSTIPTITFKDGVLTISGRSIPLHDQNQWLKKLINIMNSYAISPNDITEINIKLDYVNSESSRALVNLFTIAEKIYNDGRKVIVRWYCRNNDPLMLEQANLFQSIIEIPIMIETV
mgnify:CR=1 FL=1